MEFTDEMRDVVLQHIQDGIRRGKASELVGLTRAQFYGYMADHPEFEMRVLDAEGKATENVEEALYLAATSGNVSAAKMWLDREDRRAKERATAPGVAGLERALAAEDPAPASERSSDMSDDEFERGLNDLLGDS